MKKQIKELATTIPGIFFIIISCTCYVLGLLGKMNFSFWAMLVPFCFGLFLILSSGAAILKFANSILGVFTKTKTK